jgi:CHASE3 domain sensor protein
LSELALTIRLHQQGKSDATREITLSGIGQEQMEGIRALGADLLALETQRVETSRSVSTARCCSAASALPRSAASCCWPCSCT